jgi:hypothetical protein
MVRQYHANMASKKQLTKLGWVVALRERLLGSAHQPTVPPVGVLELFKFSTPLDVCLIITGILLGILYIFSKVDPWKSALQI